MAAKGKKEPSKKERAVVLDPRVQTAAGWKRSGKRKTEPKPPNKRKAK